MGSKDDSTSANHTSSGGVFAVTKICLSRGTYVCARRGKGRLTNFLFQNKRWIWGDGLGKGMVAPGFGGVGVISLRN